MRIKNPFIIPEGAKVTEKMFCRVLFSSICSILLCLACLVATTWAWFTVDIINKENEIITADVEVAIEITGQTGSLTPEQELYTLIESESYGLTVKLTGKGLQKPVYVLMSLRDSQGTKDYYFTFNSEGEKTLTLTVAEQTKVNFRVTWIRPDGADPVQDSNSITTVPETTPTTEPSQETTTSTATDATETTQPEETTEATQTTETAEEIQPEETIEATLPVTTDATEAQAEQPQPSENIE